MFFKRSFKVVLIVLVAFAFASVATAYAAGNNVDPSKAGDGHAAISGYDVTSIHYILNANPATIDSVTFTLDTAPVAGSTIKIKLVALGSTWYNCTNVGTAVTCGSVGSPLGATVLSADDLRVIISD